MIHPLLRQKLEEIGAHIDTREVPWEDADGDRHWSTATFVHVPGADKQFRFFGEDFDPAPYSVSSQSPGDWEDGRDWKHNYFPSATNENLHERPDEAEQHVNDLIDHLVGGKKTFKVPGYREVFDENGKRIPDASGHRRAITVTQTWKDGLHTNISLGNLDHFGQNSRTYLSTDAANVEDCPHPFVHHLARQFIEGDDHAGMALGDAIQEHHELPAHYARHYAAALR